MGTHPPIPHIRPLPMARATWKAPKMTKEALPTPQNLDRQPAMTDHSKVNEQGSMINDGQDLPAKGNKIRKCAPTTRNAEDLPAKKVNKCSLFCK